MPGLPSAMSTAVVIPFMADASGIRARNYKFVVEFYRDIFPLQVYTARGNEGHKVFCKAHVLNCAVKKLPADVQTIVFNDADSIPEIEAVLKAIAHAKDRPG